LMSVPSFVSITRRGPASGSVVSEVDGSGFVVREAVVPRRVLGAGRAFAGSGLSATVSSFFGSSVVVVSVSLGFVVVGDAVRRVVERLVRGVVREAVDLGADAGFSALGFVTVSSGVASGVGSGVGATATSAGVGSGSGKRAPADETRLPLRSALATGVSVVDASSSPASGPLMAANDPPKNKS
jgi:hypothetical protein